MKIALAGLGTVGGGLVKLLAENADLISARAGKKLEIVAASARHKEKCPPGVKFVEDARNLEADVVVEVIGGADGIARELVEKALTKKIPVITANKALLAKHGKALALLSEKQNTELRYEAAVMAAVPVVRALREGLAGEKIVRLYGIVNGSTNFMLSGMAEHGHSYAQVEAEARAKGYLEADPSLDVDGHDAAQKIALLAALAYGIEPNEQMVTTSGIRNVTQAHFKEATAAGFTIKLVAMAEPESLRVAPMLIPPSSPLARVNGAQNGLIVETQNSGRFSFLGAGAGGSSTALGVLADLIDIARGNRQSVFGVPAAALKPAKSLTPLKTGQYSAELPFAMLSE